MERYNLLVSKIIEPGLIILPTYLYARKVSTDPGFPHDNLGDFFSEVPLDGLAIRIQKEFLKERPPTAVKIVKKHEFNEITDEPTFIYLVTGDDSLRIFYGLNHMFGLDESQVIYGMFAVGFLPAIAVENPKGSFQEMMSQNMERWTSHHKEREKIPED